MCAQVGRLRLALLLDGLSQPKWVARAIAELTASPAVEIVLVILNDSPPTPKRRFARLRSWVRNRRYLLYALYQRLDRWRFQTSNDPFASVDLSGELKDIPILRVAPRMTKHCDYFEANDVETIQRYDLDVAVRLGFRILKGDALRIARNGVWSYHHGDNRINRGGPAGFWEVMEDLDVTGTVLQRLTEDLDDGEVLYRSFASTNKFSVTKNRAGYYWTSALLLRRVAEKLHRQGRSAVAEPSPLSNVWQAYSNRLYVAPKNGEMAAAFTRLARRYAAEKIRGLVTMEQWFVAYRTHNDTGADGRFVPDSTYYRFRHLIPPSDRFWADPFPVEHEGKRVIFVEEFLFRTNRGRISMFEIDDKGSAHGPTPVLERDYHLSYPFVFEWNGCHFMIPETHEAGQIELFRAAAFPHQWEFDRVLIPGVRAVDVTLAQIEKRWWMFASVANDPEMPWDELHLYYADSPFGPWTPHRENPVKSDARNSRPAGRLFRWKGELYRPAQNCAPRYGHSIVINEVVQIDPARFTETAVSHIEPRWCPNLLATHTINSDRTLTVIDGLRLRRRAFRG